MCLRCGTIWRTKALYVDRLKNIVKPTELNIAPGIDGYLDKMRAWGREPFVYGEGNT